MANTSFEIDRLVNMGVKREKIFVLGTGVDIEPFVNVSVESINLFKKKLELPETAIIIGYVGRIEITKNVLLVIKAFEKIADILDNVYLLIAGSGNEYVDEIKSYCLQIHDKVRSRIRLHLNFFTEEKAVLFNSIDVFVLPSHNESFGLVFLEAWSCKKPVIGISTGAVRNVIDDGVDGLLSNINDEESLAEKLMILIRDKSLRERMGEAGFNKVKDRYTWQIIVSRLRTCYSEAAGNKN